MIYEFRTYQLKPRTLPEVIQRFGDAIDKRLKFSPLAAFWYSEIGALNQIIHVWPYESIEERGKVRAAAVAEGAWPPKVGEFIETMQSEILQPVDFIEQMKPGEHGPYYEMRSYILKPGGLPGMIERWKEKVPARLEYSPAVAAMSTDVGTLNKWVHIWPYKSLDERVATRNKAKDDGVWPPKGDSPVVKQETTILLPAPFSPMK